ncbi:OsmC family protein [Burkholderia cepacia]|uniref:OsmC family protein n=1 Tax=Burkholderia cepacia GG4 TaxID=1009846 RepID=A0A9W3K6T3_BURCE|nr:OsmC family protein [Burkholderia cepacia]AFQ52184.1 OsmC family protein [Burkholderia cepacia GG4]
MSTKLNGIDVAALQDFAQGVANATDASKRSARFNVKTKWEHQTRSVATVSRYSLLGVEYPRHFEIAADEPTEFLGQNSAPNPQELLMAALNACLSVAYAVNAAAMGITIHSLEIETDGELDLRGVLGLDESVNPGYDQVNYVVRLDTDAPREKVEELHQVVTKTSVNLANFSKAIRMVSKLEIKES